MIIERRTFLIGLAATLATPAFKPNKFLGPVSFGRLPSHLGHRLVEDFSFANMPDGDELRDMSWREHPTLLTLYRDDEAVYTLGLNPRASFRWVCAPFSEIEIGRKNILRMVCEPAYKHCSLSMISNVELNRDRPPIKFAEVFRWEDGKPVIDSVTGVTLEHHKLLTERRT